MSTFTLHCDRQWRKVVIEETCSNWHGQEYKAYLEVTSNFDASNQTLKGYNYRIMHSMNDLLARWTSKPTEYVCHAGIEAARLWLWRMVDMDKKVVATIGYNRPQFKAMHFESAQICMPVSFESDMYWHDALLVARHNPPTFLWYVRKAGSWLILPENYGGTLHHHIKDGRYSEQVCYLWDSDTLREVT
jgi:hypothetical protein